MQVFSNVPFAAAIALAAWLAGPVRLLAADPFDATPIRFQREGVEYLLTRFSVPVGHYLYADTLAIEAAGVALIPENMPEPIMKDDPFSGEPTRIYSADFSILHRIESSPEGPLRLVVRWQGCNDQICFVPHEKIYEVPLGDLPTAAVAVGAAAPVPKLESDEDAARPEWERWLDRYEERGRIFGYQGVADFLAFLEGGAGGPAAARPRRAIGITLLLTLIGGAALNLTPCVLPMIPVNLAIIGAGMKAASRRRGFLLGGVYGLAMALAYGGLGLFVVLTGARFGSWSASRWFNGFLAAVFLVLALGMFGLFNIDFSRFQPKGTPSRMRGIAPAFVMGMISALLAGACVAPVVISVVVMAGEWYLSGHPWGLALPFVLGIGMGAPWPLAGGGLSFLPKPGAWMNYVKYAFGLLILALAIYYGSLAFRAVTPAVEGLAAALRRGIEERKPVVVDFWATWCKNCLAMDRTTLKDERVQARLSEMIFVKYQAEQPDLPPAKEVLDRFGVIGLPTYILLKPK